MPTDHEPSASRRWLLLVQQLPTRPSSPRIKTWRRLQQIGSVVLKNSVYVLPYTSQAREDFEWLATEIRAANGQASVLVAETLTSDQETEICEAFRQARSADYEALQSKAQDLSRKLPAVRAGAQRKALERSLRTLRDELARIHAIDFCGAPAKGAAEEALDVLAVKLMAGVSRATRAIAAPARLRREQYQGRVWVTRPRPGVDRMASAWLIRRFIDREAMFRFTNQVVKDLPTRDVPFDMYGAELGHQDGRCTFETLCDRFGIDDPAVRHIRTIVHDIDLKDERYDPPEGPVVARVIAGLQATYPDDEELLQHGIALFAALYQSSIQTYPAPRANPRRTTATAAKKIRSRK